MTPPQAILLRSGLFDAAWYREHNGLAGASDASTLAHYLDTGEPAGRRPNALFDPLFYRRHYLRDGAAKASPLAHYVAHGQAACAIPSADFLPRLYAKQNGLADDDMRRALVHWLRVGRPAGLAAPALPAADQLEIFLDKGSRYCLMQFRLALARELGVEDGFAVYRELVHLPDTGHLQYKPLRGLLDTASRNASAFTHIQAAGNKERIDPPRVIGVGNHRPLHGNVRNQFIACLGPARVRGASFLVETGEALLYDAEGDEWTQTDTEFAFDAAVFAGDNAGGWAIEPDGEPVLRVPEAFWSLSARNTAFGHWMWESLLKYANARAAGFDDRIPLLIDANMPVSHRHSLAWLYPGTEIIEVAPWRCVDVDRLWVTPTVLFASIFERRNEKFTWDALCAPPRAVAPCLAEIGARADLALAGAGGPGKVHLARQAWRHRKMTNHARIEEISRAAGFTVVYPDELDFPEQVRLVRNATHILAPEGSAIALCMFARRGARLTILSSPETEILGTYKQYFDAIGLDMTVLAGRLVRPHDEWPEWADYELPEAVLQRYLVDGPDAFGEG